MPTREIIYFTGKNLSEKQPVVLPFHTQLQSIPSGVTQYLGARIRQRRAEHDFEGAVHFVLAAEAHGLRQSLRLATNPDQRALQ